MRGKIIEPKLEPDLSNPNSWELGEVVSQKNFETDDKTGATTIEVPLKVGAYRAMLEMRDRFGKIVTAQLPLKVLDPDAKCWRSRCRTCWRCRHGAWSRKCFHALG